MFSPSLAKGFVISTRAESSWYPGFSRYFFGIHDVRSLIISWAGNVMTKAETEYPIVSLRRAAAGVLAIILPILPCRGAGAFVSGAGEYQLESSVQDNGGGTQLLGAGYAARGSAGQCLADEGPGLAAAGGYVNRDGFYNPPHFTFQKGLPSVVEFNSGSVSLALPSGAVQKEVFDIILNRDPIYEPMAVDPSIINSANSKLESNMGAWSRLFPGNISEISLFDEQSAWQGEFAVKGTLSMRYRDADGDGLLDGSSPPVRVETVKTWVLDESLAMWAKLPGSSVDRTGGTITVPFLSPGVYALLGMLDESVKDTYVFPVPFRPYGPKAGPGPGQSGTEADGITFANVPQAGEIEIYTLDGRLVRKLTIPAGLVIPKLKWDVRTSGGERAASGVYIWRVVSGANSKTGKLMVIW